jgi:hypothetical protein
VPEKKRKKRKKSFFLGFMASTKLEIKCKTRSFFVDPASDQLDLSYKDISDEEISEILRFILQQKLKVKMLDLYGNYGLIF